MNTEEVRCPECGSSLVHIAYVTQRNDAPVEEDGTVDAALNVEMKDPEVWKDAWRGGGRWVTYNDTVGFLMCTGPTPHLWNYKVVWQDPKACTFKVQVTDQASWADVRELFMKREQEAAPYRVVQNE